MIWLKGIFGILGKGLSLAQTIFTGKEREKDREAGRNEVKVEGHEDALDARKRIDDVEPPGAGDTVGKLHDGKF